MSKAAEQFTLKAYSLVFKGALLLAVPLLLFRPKTRAGLSQKLGFIETTDLNNAHAAQKSIWIHTVSVGEFNGAFPLIQAIQAKYPNRPIVISTTTQAGQLLAKQRMGKIAQVIYFPFDLTSVVERFLSLADPALIIIFETELWPSFISACWERKIPVAILNARMSPRSFKRYKLAKWFFGPIIRKLSLIGTQSEAESQNYKDVAGINLPIQVLGNLKYDWIAAMDVNACQGLKAKLNISASDLVLIAGSTHADEEKVVLNAYKKVLAQCSTTDKKIKLIIAPRHPERFDLVAKIIEEAGFKVCRYSHEKFTQLDEVYLLDTIGQLANFYAISSLAFVGGTIAKIGGHNLLEPYLYAVPVVCGPYLFKTKESATILEHCQALFIGQNAQEVENKIIELLQNDNTRINMGTIGKEWLENNRGAVAKSLDAIAKILDTNIGTKTMAQVSADNNVKTAETKIIS